MTVQYSTNFKGDEDWSKKRKKKKNPSLNDHQPQREMHNNLIHEAYVLIIYIYKCSDASKSQGKFFVLKQNHFQHDEVQQFNVVLIPQASWDDPWRNIELSQLNSSLIFIDAGFQLYSCCTNMVAPPPTTTPFGRIILNAPQINPGQFGLNDMTHFPAGIIHCC